MAWTFNGRILETVLSRVGHGGAEVFRCTATRVSWAVAGFTPFLTRVSRAQSHASYKGESEDMCDTAMACSHVQPSKDNAALDLPSNLLESSGVRLSLRDKEYSQDMRASVASSRRQDCQAVTFSYRNGLSGDRDASAELSSCPGSASMMACWVVPRLETPHYIRTGREPCRRCSGMDCANGIRILDEHLPIVVAASDHLNPGSQSPILLLVAPSALSV
ncbi:hypothetical protein MRB53_041608 [Persea americana]|nr:hypothetical protein MRB53_041608 [Persea americana]